MNYQYFGTGVSYKVITENSSESKEDILQQELDRYEDSKNNKLVQQITFTKANMEGDLSIIINGVTIIMKNIEVFAGDEPYNSYYRSSVLLKPYKVLVQRVDRKKATVYVSHRECSQKIKPIILNRLRRAINDSQSKPEEERIPIVLPAKVVGFNRQKNTVRLDLGGYGISGFVSGMDWSYDGVRGVSKQIKIGEAVDVEVVKCYDKKNSTNRQFCIFKCVRKSIMDDPWVGLETRYHKGDILRLICIEKKENYWFGKTLGDEELNVLVEYPQRNDGGVPVEIILGCQYECHVYYVDEKRRRLKARVFHQVLEHKNS